MSEAGVHFDLYRHLQNAIEADPERGDRTYDAVAPEFGDDIRGFADLVLFDDSNRPVLVIEAKRPSGEASRRDTDPYAPSVIRQAFDYAAELGAPYFATYNGERFVLFRTFEEGKQLLQRATKSYVVSSVEQFAGTVLDEIERLEEGEEGWDSFDDAFIQRIRTLHELITPELESAMADQIESDDAFRDSFVSWATKQGFEYDDAASDDQAMVRENFAEQAAYLLVNKIVFYKILEDSDVYEDDVRPLAVSVNRVQEDLEEHFVDVVDGVDFEAVFEHDEVYGEIPLDRISDRIREFILELEDEDLTQFDSDVIGRIYEGVIPAQRRHDLGEYYTPPAICDLITRLTVRDSDDRVLDPACGSGGFLVSAYHRKRDLLPEGRGSHGRIIDQLYGIDVNRFPAHLTAINLAIQDLESYTERVNVEVNDFFHVEPDTQRFGRERASASGEDVEGGVVEALGDMDAVVGNPPYIRARNIDDKERIRAHLSGIDGEFISKRMDIYGYFITHATAFLNADGKLGFIISDRWLDTAYGADLQDFICQNYEIRAVIKFDKQAFTDALVGSSVVILNKQPEAEERDRNIATFLRIRESVGIDEIASIVEQEADPDVLVNHPDYRLVTREQHDLRENEKWNVYFIAPPIYFDILSHPKTTELQDLAEITRGLTTGANDFYYGRYEEWEDLGLEDYVTPLLKASGQLDKIRFGESDAEEWGVLDLHPHVEDALDDAEEEHHDVRIEAEVKNWLSEHDHKPLVEYINWGEDQGYHERPTTSARDIWFDLGELARPPMLMTDFTWRIFRVIWNDTDATSDAQFYNLMTEEGVDPELLCGILNSRIGWLMTELRGRRAGGEGMTRARIKVYEAEELPVPDPNRMSQEQKQRIRDAFKDLIQREDELEEGGGGRTDRREHGSRAGRT